MKNNCAKRFSTKPTNEKKFNMLLKTCIFMCLFAVGLVKGSMQPRGSTVENMLQFLDTEATMVQTLLKFIKEQSQKLNTLKRYNEDRRMKRNLIEDEDALSTNPLNILRAIKFLYHDFEYLEKVMENQFDSLKSKMFDKNNVLLPNEKDIENAVLDLVNLQRVYDIPAEDIIKGGISSSFPGDSISVEDCISISRILAENNDHEFAIQWSEVCVAETTDIKKKTDLLDIIIKSWLYIGDKMMALSKIRESLRLSFNNRGLMDLKVQLMTELNQFNDEWEVEMDEASRACRGEYAGITDKLNLKCRYVHEKSPFLKIAPLKEEELFLNPKIVMYREIIYDSEIQLLVNSAKNRLESSTVLGDNNERKLDINYRTGQTAFLNNTWDMFKAIYQRCIDFSELSMTKAEWFQVINYAPGGYYKVHSDRIQSPEEIGNRMATALFYLNDVILGGGTIFTKLRLLVKPEKGSVLFWFNKAEEEHLSRHAACPVVLGEKWAFTEWFREGGQDRSLRN